jgi:hypothetical protein
MRICGGRRKSHVAYVTHHEPAQRRIPCGVGLLIAALVSAALWVGIFELIGLI